MKSDVEQLKERIVRLLKYALQNITSMMCVIQCCFLWYCTISRFFVICVSIQVLQPYKRF